MPILLNPLLDYSATVQENGTKLTIDITNLGLGSANDIISSVSAKNVAFSNFESEPYLENQFRANSTVLGKGFFEISTMPPRSETFVTATLDAPRSEQNKDLKVYLRSDERVGFHDTLITGIFYLGLGVTYVMVFIYLVYWGFVSGSKTWLPLDLHTMRYIASYVLVITGAEIYVTVLYYIRYFPPIIGSLPPVK